MWFCKLLQQWFCKDVDPTPNDMLSSFTYELNIFVYLYFFMYVIQRKNFCSYVVIFDVLV